MSDIGYWNCKHRIADTKEDSMISEIHFENYRCFEKSRIKYKELAIMVGKNNAGKSSMIEALRMIAYASGKAQRTNYRTIFPGLGLSLRHKGIRVDTDKLKIDLRGIVYLYENKVAKITAIFDDGCKIIILADTDVAFAVLYNPEGKNIGTKVQAQKYHFGNISILPPLGLIKENEKRLAEDTVINDRDTYLSSRHFRNEVLLYKDNYWNDFKTLAEKSWEGLSVIGLDYNISESENIRFMVSDSRFPGEIGVMGSGLQMWLQIIWFICRSKGMETIILDEPDVYMHPDLQIRLLHLVRKIGKQVIIATHSVEIISEVSPNDIVMIDKNSRNMRYANSLKAVQNIVDYIGGVQNLSLIRIGLKKRCLFVEGKDVKILSKLYDVVYPEKENIFQSLPVIELHGFTNLSEAFGTSNLFYQETKGQIECVCILDRDYYPDEVLLDKYNRAEENHLILHIWKKKEIENYLLVPSALFRITKQTENDYDKFLERLNVLLDEEKDGITDQLAQHILEVNRGKALPTCYAEAREVMKNRWTTTENKLSMVSGKSIIKKIAEWMKREYNVNCSKALIINSIYPHEINREIIDVFELIG